MTTFAEEIATRNLKFHDDGLVTITNEGLNKLDRKLAEALDKNEQTRQESAKLAADTFSR